MLTPAESRKALRSFKQRGIVVHVGALEQLYDAYKQVSVGTFAGFLDKAFDLLSSPDGAVDGILTKALAVTIGDQLKRSAFCCDGELSASLDVIDVFTVPLWRPNAVASNISSTGAVSKTLCKPLVDAAPLMKSDLFRSRYDLVLSKTLRNERFKPPLSGVSAMTKKSAYFELTGMESLPSRKGDCLVLGMLTQLEDGVWFLEDINGTVRLDLSQASVTAGLHTDGSFVIAQGVLVDDDETTGPTFHVSAMGTPPLEARERSIDLLGKDANLFGGHFDFNRADQLLQMEKQAEDSVFLFISDVALDNSRVLAGLGHLFDGYLEDKVIPTVIVLMGNFLSHPFGQKANDLQLLQDGFAHLGMMIKTKFEPIARSSTFVIIPSTSDVGPGNVLPRPSLPSIITRSFTSALEGATVHYATNPCRIRYMTQEIVVMRDDIMQKMVRHCCIKPDFSESGLMCEHLVKTVIDQAYLSPLPLLARPVLWAHHNAMWLFPTPHAVVLADKVDGFICKYGGSLGLNPGSFSTDFSFMVYLPAERRAQLCSLDSEDVKGTTNDEGKVVANQMLTPIDRNEILDDDYEGVRESLDVLGDREPVSPEQESVPKGEDSDDGEIVIDENVSEDPESSGKEDVDLVQPGQSSDDASESDDESLLVPAEGLKRIDIKALVQSAIATDTSTVGQQDDDDNDESNEDDGDIVSDYSEVDEESNL